MTTDEINKILSCIGRPVTFKYPGEEGTRHGILQDRAVFHSHFAPGEVPYWDVIDLIAFKDEPEECIRIGYYRKPRQKLNWGAQTTITEPVSVWKEMLIEVAREKLWFRKLLEDVVSELEK